MSGVRRWVKNEWVEVPWKVEYHADDDDTNSAREMKEKGYTLPEYCFVAEYDGVESDMSKVLEVKDTLHKQLIAEETDEILPNINYAIKFAGGQERRGATDEDGYIHEDYIPLGEFTITVEEN